MARRANVSSIESIRAFRPVLVKFAERVRNGLGEVQSEMQRTAQWLEQEQAPHWQRQIRKRQEALQQAKQALNQKKMYETVDDAKASVVDEEREVRKQQRLLEEAEQKLAATKRWRRELEREWTRQQGALNQLNRATEHDVPRLVGLLDRLGRSLEDYVAFTAKAAEGKLAERDAAAADAGGSMARPETSDQENEDDSK